MGVYTARMVTWEASQGYLQEIFPAIIKEYSAVTQACAAVTQAHRASKQACGAIPEAGRPLDWDKG